MALEDVLVRAQELLASKGTWAATVAALVLVLQYSRARKLVQLTHDLRHVGTAEGEPGSLEHEFDVIIAGGGTAGCVLASRISEDPSTRVLLLESGGSGLTNILSRTPALFGSIMNTENCWNYYTEPQTALIGKTKKYWPQGRMLGGSSSMNAMMAHYGCPEDYDQWARENSDPGSEIWAHKNLSKYFLKFENYISHKMFLSVDASLRGSGGPVDVGHHGYFSKITSDFMRACIQVGLPHVPDANTAFGTLGVTKIMTFITPRARRVSAESAYLTPQVLSRPNLKVAVHAHVVRILFEKIGGVTRATGVEFTKSQNGPRFRAKATKEVVISAGAMHTPQVLMLSGIGPSSHLASLSIPLVLDLPGVGSHLRDHIVVNTTYRDKTNTSLSFSVTTLRDQLRRRLNIIQWTLFGTGPLSTNTGEAAAFLRSTDAAFFKKDELPPVVEDSTSGPGAPDLEIFLTPMPYKEHGFGKLPVGHFFSVSPTLLRPTSTGTITLRSSNPFDQPVINPRYLSTEHDLNVLIRGLKLTSRITQTLPLRDSLDETEQDALLDHQLQTLSDVELAEVVRSRVETLYHPCSTARMAPLEEGGVLDPYLRVHGILNLRVVDASVFPNIVAGHTAGPVLAVAEHAADIIKTALGTLGVKA